MSVKDLIKSVFGTSDPEQVVKLKTSQESPQLRALEVRPSLVQMTPDECKRACRKVGLEYQDGYENRVLAYMITNEVQDRYGDVVRVAGGNFEEYMKNPVVMFAHKHDIPPIGKCTKVDARKKDKQVFAHGLFFDDRMDPTGLSETIFRLALGGGMPGCSIGFLPRKWNRPTTQQERAELGLGEYGVEFTAWDLLEWSTCAIPANPTALQVDAEVARAIKSMAGTENALRTKDFDVLEKFGIIPQSTLRDTFRDVFGVTIVKCDDDNTSEVIVENSEPDQGDTVAEVVVSDPDEKKPDGDGPDVEEVAPDETVSDNSDVEVQTFSATIQSVSPPPVNVTVNVDVAPIIDAIKNVKELISCLAGIVGTMDGYKKAIDTLSERVENAMTERSLPKDGGSDDSLEVKGVYDDVFGG